MKFEIWLKHRQKGDTIFTELRLKQGRGRPDVVVIEKGTNEIFVVEVVKSEKEASIIAKKNKYPWPLKVVYANKKRKRKAKGATK